MAVQRAHLMVESLVMSKVARKAAMRGTLLVFPKADWSAQLKAVRLAAWLVVAMVVR